MLSQLLAIGSLAILDDLCTLRGLGLRNRSKSGVLRRPQALREFKHML